MSSERQRRLGPAPIASFEDLSDELSSPEDKKKLEKIAEERLSPLATPTTPRIDVDHASSPSQKSSESIPDIFAFESGLIFMEGARKELQSCVQELDNDDKQKDKDVPKNASEPSRVPLQAPSHLPLNRLTSTSSDVSTSSRRSPSPHRMLLETSFCGSKPVNDEENNDTGSLLRASPSFLTPTGTAVTPSSNPSSPNLPRRPIKYVTEPRSRPVSPNPVAQSPTQSVDSRSAPLSRKPSEYNDTSCLDDLSSDNVSLPSRKVSEATDSNFDHLVSSQSSSPQSVRRYDQRPQTLSTLSSSSKRAVSPFRMIYETSFCGAKPIESECDVSEPLFLSLSRTPSRATSPRPVMYKSEPRSRPVSPLPPKSATLPTSPLPLSFESNHRKNVTRERTPSPRRIYETSFVTNQHLSVDEADVLPVKFELKPVSPRAIRYATEPRSRPTSPAVRKPDIESKQEVNGPTPFDTELLIQKVNAHMEGVETFKYDPRDRSDSISCEINFLVRGRGDNLTAKVSPGHSRSVSPRVKYETSFCGSKPKNFEDEPDYLPPPSPRPELMCLPKPIKYESEPRSRSVSPQPMRGIHSPGGDSQRMRRAHSPMMETSFCGCKPQIGDENHFLADASSACSNQTVEPIRLKSPIPYETEPRSRPIDRHQHVEKAYDEKTEDVTPVLKSRVTFESEPRSKPVVPVTTTKAVVTEPQELFIAQIKTTAEICSLDEKSNGSSERGSRPHRDSETSVESSDFIVTSKNIPVLNGSNSDIGFSSFKTVASQESFVTTPVEDKHYVERRKSPVQLKSAPKPVACPRVPETFKAVSTSTTPSGSPLGARRPLGISNLSMAAGSAPSTPLPARKTSTPSTTKTPEPVKTIENKCSTPETKKKGSKMFRFFKGKKKRSSSTASTPDLESPDPDHMEDYIGQSQVAMETSMAKEVMESFAAFEASYAVDSENWETQMAQGRLQEPGSAENVHGDSDGSDVEEPVIQHEMLPHDKDDVIATVEPEVENLVLNDSFEGELPFVPTTLPQELPLAIPITPIRMRIAQFKETRRVERPRAAVKGPAPFDAYLRGTGDRSCDDIKIRLPQIREESIEEKITIRKQKSLKGNFDWAKFAQTGLRSIKIYITEDSFDEEQQKPIDVITIPEPVTAATQEVRKWVDPEQLPEQPKPIRKLSAQPVIDNQNRKLSDSLDHVPDTEVTHIYVRPIPSVLSPGDYSSGSTSVNNDGSRMSEVGLLERRSDSDSRDSSHDRSSLISSSSLDAFADDQQAAFKGSAQTLLSSSHFDVDLESPVTDQVQSSTATTVNSKSISQPS